MKIRQHLLACALSALSIALMFSSACSAQAALLIEQPYGFFGTANPTGHSAMYFERVCAETPIRVRRCRAGELGAVISRYNGISGYDWLAIPLVPYLYSVEEIGKVKPYVDAATVEQLRNRYHEAHLMILGNKLRRGNIAKAGWSQLVGGSYDRRIYAFRFDTSEAQDDALIASLNSHRNHSHFNLLVNNCADFSRKLLNIYYPRHFKRKVLPNAGVTSPKQVVRELGHFAAKHPEMQLTVFEIPQIPGSRRASRTTKDVDESLVTSVYEVPIALVNPYIAGALLVDYLLSGRYHIIPKHPTVLTPDELTAWARPTTATTEPSEQADLPARDPSNGTTTPMLISEPNLKGSVPQGTGAQKADDSQD